MLEFLGTKFSFSLTKAQSKFVLMKKATDTEKYQLKITNILLFVPVAALSQSVFNEFSSYQTKKIDNKPVGIPYRNIEIRPYNVPRNTPSFYSELLFTGTNHINLLSDLCMVTYGKCWEWGNGAEMAQFLFCVLLPRHSEL